MEKQSKFGKVKEWIRTHFKLPFGVKVVICLFPFLLVILFYIFRTNQGFIEWVTVFISKPVRTFLSMVFSLYPIALTEIFITLAVIFLFYYLIKAVMDSWRRRERWKILGKRMLWLLVTACYFFAAFCWLWSSGYYAKSFAEKHDLVSSGIQTEDLIMVTEMFAERANELSVLLERDEDGNLVYKRSEMFAQSRYIFKNISEEFPMLGKTVYSPKPMYIYSWLMTITGYSGVYLALTGESMVNIDPPLTHLPATVAHELAHQLGIYAEDEATLVGILACVTSDNPVFEYSGLLVGLNYLSGALAGADGDECTRIMSGLTDEVKRDRAEHSLFWMNARASNLGIDWLDNALSSIKEAANTVVDAVYDDYLKSQDQEYGLATYGKCVDLLVIYYTG